VHRKDEQVEGGKTNCATVASSREWGGERRIGRRRVRAMVRLKEKEVKSVGYSGRISRWISGGRGLRELVAVRDSVARG
jgi:hypothetical protein